MKILIHTGKKSINVMSTANLFHKKDSETPWAKSHWGIDHVGVIFVQVFKAIETVTEWK